MCGFSCIALLEHLAAHWAQDDLDVNSEPFNLQSSPLSRWATSPESDKHPVYVLLHIPQTLCDCLSLSLPMIYTHPVSIWWVCRQRRGQRQSSPESLGLLWTACRPRPVADRWSPDSAGRYLLRFSSFCSELTLLSPTHNKIRRLRYRNLFCTPQTQLSLGRRL